MQAYGSVAAPIGHTTHVPLPTSPVGRGLDPFQQLERAHSRVSPIRQAPAIDPDAVARLKRLGILVEEQPKVLVRKTKRAPGQRKPRPRAHTRRLAAHEQRSSRIDVPALIEAYQDGTSITELCKRFSCSRNTAKRHLQLAGIEIRDERRRTGTRDPRPETMSAQRHRQVLELHAAGTPFDDIVAAVGWSATTVRQHLRTAGIDVPARKTGPRPTFDVDLAAQQAHDGMTVSDIARHHGVSFRAITMQLERRGVPHVDGRRAEHRSAHIDTDRIVALYQQGHTVKEVAQAVGCGIPTARRRLVASGIPMRDDRTTNSGGHNHLPAETEQLIVDLYGQGMTGREVAARLGIGTTSVGRVLRASGITMRPAAEVQRGRPGKDGATGLKDLMAANGVTSADVRAWATSTGRPVPDRGLPSRQLVEDYLLARRIPA